MRHYIAQLKRYDHLSFGNFIFIVLSLLYLPDVVKEYLVLFLQVIIIESHFPSHLAGNRLYPVLLLYESISATTFKE